MVEQLEVPYFKFIHLIFNCRLTFLPFSPAPQNHFFGPGGDPRGAGIGTPEAIINVWSCHREVVEDFGPIPATWKTPKAI